MIISHRIFFASLFILWDHLDKGENDKWIISKAETPLLKLYPISTRPK